VVASQTTADAVVFFFGRSLPAVASGFSVLIASYTILNPIFCAICTVDKSRNLCYNLITKEKEMETMSKKKNNKELDRRVFKKEGEDLQQWLIFTRRGSKAKAKKGKGSYNRQEFKKGE
jgi:hypothetical protein